MTRKYTRPSLLPGQLRTDQSACERDLEISDCAAILAASPVAREHHAKELAIGIGFNFQSQPLPGFSSPFAATAAFADRSRGKMRAPGHARPTPCPFQRVHPQSREIPRAAACR